MVQKRFGIALDIKRSSSNRPIEVVEGDNTNLLEITLTDDGQPVDLTDCRVAAIFSAGGRTVQQDNDGNGILMDPETPGRFTIELYPSSFAPGLVECEVLVLSGEQYASQATSAKFNFSCRRSIMNADTILATDEYPILAGLIQRVEQSEATLRTMSDEEDIRQANELAREAGQSVRETYTAKLANLRASVTALAEGSAPTAALTELETAFELALGIPKGDTGDVFHHGHQHASGGTDPLAPEDIGAAPAAITRTAALSAEGWVGSSAPYTQSVSVSGITSEMEPLADIILSAVQATAEAELKAWALISKIETGGGFIEATCFKDKPSIDLNLKLKAVG